MNSPKGRNGGSGISMSIPQSLFARTTRGARHANEPYVWGAFICQGDPGPLRPHRAAEMRQL